MSRVRAADTKPEWVLRCGLHRLGYRYRLGNKNLPGRPDLVFPKYRAVVFVHGCYWHRHPGCEKASTPKSNRKFWTAKFAQNLERDRRVEGELRALGWRVLVVWECELMRRTVETFSRVVSWLGEGMATDDKYRYAAPVVDRHRLLAIAEDKVRYRLATYEEGSEGGDSAGTELEQS